VKVIERLADLRRERGSFGRLAVVPTMGYLHEGHQSLIRAARAEPANRTVLMTLFVNPAQFGPNEDFASYPRDIPRDLRLAEEAGADVVFLPPLEDVYPADFDTWVEPGALTRRWEGERRPGHFRGVATVVLKLFNMVRPDTAYFGEKDYQQLLVVRKMVADLNLPIDVVGCPTIREPSGLALSSRNFYYRPGARTRAAVLSRALFRAQALVAEGARDSAALLRSMREVLASEPAAAIDYLAVVDPRTLEPLERVTDRARVLAAMHLEGVRLIDNVPLVVGDTTVGAIAD
jgi:pantoate--beta-alanine ligase